MRVLPLVTDETARRKHAIGSPRVSELIRRRLLRFERGRRALRTSLKRSGDSSAAGRLDSRISWWLVQPPAFCEANRWGTARSACVLAVWAEQQVELGRRLALTKIGLLFPAQPRKQDSRFRSKRKEAQCASAYVRDGTEWDRAPPACPARRHGRDSRVS